MICCLVVGVCLISKAMYMDIKALVAQKLLVHTWDTIVNEVENKKITPWPWADFYPVANLTFNRFKLSQIVLNNDSGQSLAFGPGLTGNGSVNLEGVVIISAHNDTHFKVLNKLEQGDEISLETESGNIKTYQMHDTQVIDIKGNNFSIDSSVNGLYLVTCYPFRVVGVNSDQRYIAFAKPINTEYNYEPTVTM
jgi:sortase A